MSTHFIHPYGMLILAELGLADRVQAVATPITTMVNTFEGERASFDVETPGTCPRRTELDAILLDGARESGAEVRLQTRVVDVLREGERVVGVIAQDRDGNRSELRARVVVGADGRHSTIADLVSAEKYLSYDGPRIAYWAYWPRPSWYSDAAYGEHRTHLFFDGVEFRWSFPTNRDQLILGVGAPQADLPLWKADPRAVLRAKLREHPFFARLVDAEPISKTLGITKAEFFFRRAAGPGWALVGDAGLFKDPTPGLGISDALRDARALSAAIVEGSDAALERYWRQRDVDSLELFSMAQDMGEIEYNNPVTQLVMRKAARSPELRRRFVDVLMRRHSPYALLSPLQAIGLVLGALVRGKFGVLRPFLKMAKRQARVQKELKHRRALLVAAGVPSTAPVREEKHAA